MKSNNSNCKRGEYNHTIDSLIPEGTQGEAGLWAEILRLDEVVDKKDKVVARMANILNDEGIDLQTRVNKALACINRYKEIHNTAIESNSEGMRFFMSGGLLQ
jgi:hypothetical protein